MKEITKEKIFLKPIMGLIYKSTNQIGAIFGIDNKGQKYIYEFDKKEAEAWNKECLDNLCWVHNGCIEVAQKYAKQISNEDLIITRNILPANMLINYETCKCN